MAWEKRGKQLVYYRKQRGEDGRVRSIYCGSGERGELAAREDAERRGACATDNLCAGGHLIPEVTEVRHEKKGGVQLGGVGLKREAESLPVRTPKKEAVRWPSFSEVLQAQRNYAALCAVYPAHTLPAAGEPLDAWLKRRQCATETP